MTEQKYTGFGSRIVFDTDNASSKPQENKFQPGLVSDKPEVKVEQRYFTFQLKPQSYQHCNQNINQNQNNYQNNKHYYSGDDKRNILTNNENAKYLDARPSPTEVTSSESFYSCRSSVSLQTVSAKNSNDITYKTSSSSQMENQKKETISDEDLLNQLTMVNAIFLSEKVSQCNHKDNSYERKKYENEINSQVKQDLKTFKSPEATNIFCPETFTCQISPNVGIKYINKISGDKHISNNNSFMFNKPEGERVMLPKNENSNEQTFLNSFSSELFESKTVAKSNSNKNSEIKTIFKKYVPSKFIFRKRKRKNLRTSSYKKKQFNDHKINFAEPFSFVDEKCLPVSEGRQLEGTINKRKQSMNNQNFSLNLKNFNEVKDDSSFFSTQNKTNLFKNDEIVCGDGLMRGENKTVSINSSKLNDEVPSFMKTVDESYLKTLINESLMKLQNETFKNISNTGQNNPNYFQLSDSEDETNISDEDDDTLIQKTLISSDVSFRPKNNKMSVTDNEIYPHDGDDDVKIETDKFLPTPSYCTNSQRFNQEINYYKQEYQSENPIKESCVNRKMNDKKSQLPVIEEESSETLASRSSEDNIGDDYCLVDSNGRPIHLFDIKGLPLTDHCGRPLRSVKGRLLMKCDENGIPVVDYDNCTIFDMFGRQPHEDKFDPSMAPKTPVCSKLSMSDGKPLLLYDIEGRPLTSVSGTMLVDSSGRGLVRLTSNLQESQ